jgi:glycerol-3-phosphate O-acyltransferase
MGNNRKMKSYHQEIGRVTNGVESFFSTTFNKVHLDGPKLDPVKIQQQPTMGISTHRSHVDYFLFGHELFKMGFSNLRFAAGDNLTKLPYVGPKFQSLGAFTVSRDTGFERNYVRNLCSSVMTMMESGDMIIVFPEGGRSYSGATLEIKSGILGAGILLQSKYPDKDIFYIPAALSYENLPDLPYFKLLLKGKKLRKRTNFVVKRLIGNIFYFGGDLLAFAPFLSAPRLNRKYGDVYIDYLEPISIRSVLDIKANKQESSRDEFSAHRVSMQLFSQHIYGQLKSLYRLLPVHVLAAVLNQKNPLVISEARENVGKLIDNLQAKPYNLKQFTNMNNTQIVEKGISQLLRFNAITADHGILSVKKPEIIKYFNASIDKTGD